MPDDAEMAQASFSLVFTKEISPELVSDAINAEEEWAGKGQGSLGARSGISQLHPQAC